MPKLWNETINAHRQAVRDALLEKTAALAMEQGVSSVTMTQVAETTGIGRATLYKYFPDVESILAAWHEQRIGEHLHQLTEIVQRGGDIEQRFEKVLQTYALIDYAHHGSDLAPVLHHGAHSIEAQHQLLELMRGLLAEGVVEGVIRDDVPAEELARYCLSSLSASSSLRSKAAVRRLVKVTLSGVRSRR